MKDIAAPHTLNSNRSCDRQATANNEYYLDKFKDIVAVLSAVKEEEQERKKAFVRKYGDRWSSN